MQNVAIFGASDKPDRYSYKALKLLEKYGHNPIPIHPFHEQIDGRKVHIQLHEITDEVDTLTMYVNPKISSDFIEEIVNLAPKRIIFNPGSENPEIYPVLKEYNIPYEEACTLVLLNTGQFDF